MENKAIPKHILKYKTKILKNFGWIDFIIVLIALTFFVFTIVCLGKITSFIIAFVISLIIGIFIASLTLNFKNEKLYNYLVKFITFSINKNKVHDEKNISGLIAYSFDKKKNFIKYNDVYLSFIKINGFELSLLQEQEQDKMISYFQNVINSTNFKFSFLKIDNQLNLKNQKEFLEKKIKEFSKEESRIKTLNLQKDILENLQKNERFLINDFYFVIEGSEKIINSNIEFIINYLNLCNLKPEIIDEEKQLKNIIENFYGKNNLNNIDNISFYKNYFKINNSYLKIIGIFDNCQYSYNGWLNNIFNLENCMVIQRFKEIDRKFFKKRLDNVILNQETDYLRFRKQSQKTETEKYFSKLRDLVFELSEDGEKIFKSMHFVIVKGNSLIELKENYYKIKNNLENIGMEIDNFYYLQREAWLDSLIGSTGFYSKYSSVKNFTKDKIQNELTSSLIAQSFPFSQTSLIDKNGLFFGNSFNGSSLFLDINKRNAYRKNGNMIILGKSGAGKSTATKKIAYQRYLAGDKIIAIDPEREYDVLAKNLNGNIINFGTDKSENDIKLNPLQFFVDIDKRQGSLETHISFLTEFFDNVFMGLNQIQKTLIEGSLKELYEEKGIITKIENKEDLKNEDFPLMSDFAKNLQVKCKKINDENIKKIYNELFLLFNSFANEGTPKNILWEGYTNFDISNDFNVFDIHSLVLAGNKQLMSSQYFLLLKYISNIGASNKNNKSNKFITIIIDEAHILSFSKYGTDFLVDLVKRARKYNINLVLATQSVSDFLGKNDKSKLESIFHNIQYQLILNMHSKDVQNLDNLFSSSGGLTELEKEILINSMQGQGLLILDDLNRFNVEISLFKEELDLFQSEKEKIQRRKND